MIKITNEVLESLLEYLTKKPYEEVFDLIEKLKQSPTVREE